MLNDGFEVHAELRDSNAPSGRILPDAAGKHLLSLFGLVLVNRDPVPLSDFRTAYFSGVCLLEPGCHPFQEADVERLYWQRQVDHPPVPQPDRTVITRNIYLPTAFAFTVPMALVPFKIDLALWAFFIAAGSIVAALLMWRVSAGYAPLLSAALLSYCLANSGSIFHFGNAAGIVVPLCIIAAWCFVEGRYIPVAVVCLIIGLAFKPHDTGLVWLCFLLAGGRYRRHAFITGGLFALLALPTVAWVTHISPQWLHELSSNLGVGSGPGGMNYPGAVHATCMLTNLQTITSVIWFSARTYNLAAILIWVPFVLVWGFLVWKSNPTRESVWFALAAAAAFSLLPTYHRQYDAKLIMLAVPACAILWSRRGRAAWVGLLITGITFFLNADLPWIVAFTALDRIPILRDPANHQLVTALFDFPVPLSLLALGTFNLWAFARFSRTAPAEPHDAASKNAPAALNALS